MSFKLEPGLKVKYTSDSWGVPETTVMTLTEKCNCCESYLTDCILFDDPTNCQYISPGMVDAGWVVLAFEAEPGENCVF